MAKKVSKAVAAPVLIQEEEKPAAEKSLLQVRYPGIPAWLYDFKVQAFIIAILAGLFYINTFRNEYALDDTVVILRNDFVHKGFAGIPDILGKDAYYSYYKQLNSSNQLSGGRYRPLSIVTFAIEQQFFGAVQKGKVDSISSYGVSYDAKAPYEKNFLQQMHVRHLFNVAWYVLAVVVLLYFLRYVVFRADPLMAFIAVVIFTVHPLHTEVVANVKSRDEIMSLLFISLTFILAFRYRENTAAGKAAGSAAGPRRGGLWLLAAALACYFLAFLSKEYAITLVLLLPLSFYLFNGDTVKKSIISSLPYLCVAIVYVIIRSQIIGPRSELSDNDIQINPYAFASASEKLATEIATSLNYVKLLIFPHPLSSDYSYNQIPYKDFSNPLVWFSGFVHLALAGGMVYFFRKRSVLCFAIAFYFFNLLMVNNFLFDIGATMGERLIFHASVGFCIGIAWLLVKGMDKINNVQANKVRTGSAGLGVFMLLIVILSAFKTIERNKDWKNDETLFMKDIEVSPNSFLVNENVGVMLINRAEAVNDEEKKKEDLRTGVRLFTKVIGMQNDYVLGYLNRSVAYLKLGMGDSMVADLDRIKALYPIHPQLPAMYFYAGDLFLSGTQYEKAAAAFQASLKLYPGDKGAQAGLKAASDAMKTTGP